MNLIGVSLSFNRTEVVLRQECKGSETAANERIKIFDTRGEDHTEPALIVGLRNVRRAITESSVRPSTRGFFIAETTR